MGEKQTKEKPLDKMTATEMREIAKEIPEIVGVHGMNKPELLKAIKQARDIEDKSSSKNLGFVRELKKKIKEFKVQRDNAIEVDDTKMAAIFRKRIIRLKKKTRKTA